MVTKIWRYIYSFWQNSRTWQTDKQTHTHKTLRQTPHDGIGRGCIASRGKKANKRLMHLKDKIYRYLRVFLLRKPHFAGSEISHAASNAGFWSLTTALLPRNNITAYCIGLHSSQLEPTPVLKSFIIPYIHLRHESNYFTCMSVTSLVLPHVIKENKKLSYRYQVALSIITVFPVEQTVEIFYNWLHMTSDCRNWLRAFKYAVFLDNETVYSNWNDLRSPLKVNGNGIMC